MHSRYCVLRSPTNCWINPTSRQKHKKNTPPNIQKHNTTLFIFSIFYTPLLACGHVENLRTFWYHLRNRFDCGQSFDLWPVIWGNYWVILHHWIHAKDCALAQLDAVLRRQFFFIPRLKRRRYKTLQVVKITLKKSSYFLYRTFCGTKQNFFFFRLNDATRGLFGTNSRPTCFVCLTFFFLAKLKKLQQTNYFLYIYILFFFSAWTNLFSCWTFFLKHF